LSLPAAHGILLFMRKENILIILFLLAAAVICYHNVLDADFVWDDEYLVELNPSVRAPLLSLYPFRQDIISSNFIYTIYYRPIQILSYAVDYRLWGLNPLAFHLSNIMIHFLNGLLVFILTGKLSGKRSVALLAALLFVIHPMHVGSVAYISGRADLLFFLFGFLFMLLYILFREGRGTVYLAGSVLFLILSLLSKEAALIFPFLLVFMEAMLLGKRFGFRPLYHVPNFLVAGGYAVLHRSIFGARYPLLMGQGRIAEGLSRYFIMVRDFLAISVFPSGLHMRRGSGGSGTWLVFALVIAIAAALFFNLKKSRRMLVFSTGFFLIGLIPFVFVAGYFGVLAEHWMYLPSYGVFLFMSVAAMGFFGKKELVRKAAVAALVFVAVVFYSLNTMVQSIYWHDNISLSDRVLSYSDKDMPAMHFKAVSLVRKGEKASSAKVVEEYIETYPRDARALYIKGRIDLAADRPDAAERAFKKAVEIAPGYDNGYFGLALTEFVKERQREGIDLLERTVSINPKHSEALFLLGTAYSRMGEHEKALGAAERAVEISPYDYNVLVNLGTVYARKGDLQNAARTYLKAATMYPERPEAQYDLAYTFYVGGQTGEAEVWLRKALMTDPYYKPAIKLIQKIREEKTAKSGT